MGRTVVPVRYEVEGQLEELRRFVRGLRQNDMRHFDALYADVKKHISAITYANPLNPSVLMQWSALIEIEKKIQKLKNEIDRCFHYKG